MKLSNQAKKVSMVMAAAAVTAVVGFAAMTYAKPPGGGFGCGPRNCLDVWQPVICSDGQVYSNLCYAQRACATGCVPYGAQ